MNSSEIITDQCEAWYFNTNQSYNISTTMVPSHNNVDDARDLILLIILALLIITINGLITFSFILVKKLRQRPANIMICSQACTDLFNGIIYIPNSLIENELAQTLRLFLSCYMLCLSLFNLLVISLDRYLALCKPFIHRRYVDVGRTTKLISLVWTLPLIIVLIPLLWWFGDFKTKTKATNIYICTIWMLMLVLVVSMTVLYILATRSARNTIQSRISSLGSYAQDKAATLARKELRVVHLFGLLLFFFASAYLPILYINFCIIVGMEILVPPVMETVSLYLLTVNSVLNPILCILLKKDYLRAIKRICLRRYGINTDTKSVSSQYATVPSSAGSFLDKSSINLSERKSTQRTVSESISEKEIEDAKTSVCGEIRNQVGRTHSISSLCSSQRCRLYYILTPVCEERAKVFSQTLRATSI